MRKTSNVGLSIIIPAYKAEETIGRAIDSVQSSSQSLTVEIIVVEDGKFDGTGELIQRKFPSVRLVQLKENKGGAHARNCGLELASHRFVMFLDADDFVTEGFTLNSVEALVIAGADVCFGRCEKRWPNNRTEVTYEPRTEDNTDVLFRWFIGKSGPGTCSVVWNRDALIKIGGWDESLKMNQDGELVMRAMLHCFKVVHCFTGAGVYWQHDGESVSKSRSDSDLESLIRVGKRIDDLLQKFESSRKQQLLRIRPIMYMNMKLRLVQLGASAELLQEIPSFTLIEKVKALVSLRGSDFARYLLLYSIGPKGFVKLKDLLQRS